LEVSIGKKTGALEECKASEPDNKKKIKKLTGGLKKAKKGLVGAAESRAEAAAAILECKDRVAAQEQAKAALITNFSAPRQVTNCVGAERMQLSSNSRLNALCYAVLRCATLPCLNC
jgi:hypothetical protein